MMAHQIKGIPLASPEEPTDVAQPVAKPSVAPAIISLEKRCTRIRGPQAALDNNTDARAGRWAHFLNQGNKSIPPQRLPLSARRAEASRTTPRGTPQS